MIQDLRRLAQIQQTQKHWLEASELYASIIERFPEALAFHDYANLANCYLQLSRYEESTHYYQLLDERYPEIILGLRGLAQIQQTQKHWLEASELYASIIERFPEALAFHDYANLANCYLQLADNEVSVRAYEFRKNALKALKLLKLGIIKFDSHVLFTILQKLYLRYSSRRFAIADYDAFIRVNSELQSEESRLLKINLLLSHGSFDLSKKYIEESRLVGVEFAELVVMEVTLYRAIGDYKSAADRVLECKGNHCVINKLGLENIAFTLFSTGMSIDFTRDFLETHFDSALVLKALDNLFNEKTKKINNNFLLNSVKNHLDYIKTSDRKIYRNLLKKFLKNRTYEEFKKFVEFSYSNFSEFSLDKVRKVIGYRFPKSSLAARLSEDSFNVNIDVTSEKNAKDYLWQRLLPRKNHSIKSQLQGFKKVDLLLVSFFKNEAEMIPYFLDHYAKLGVKNFLFINNGSSDDFIEKFKKYERLNCTIIDAPYDFGMNHHGVTWLNEILDQNISKWSLFVDLDEFLIYPGSEDFNIDILISHMESEGCAALEAFMVDVYDDNYSKDIFPSDEIKQHRYFYASYAFNKGIDAPYKHIYGGIRFSNSTFKGILQKVPLVNSSLGVRYLGNHSITPAKICLTTGALVHYKVFRDREYLQLTPEELMQEDRIKFRGLHCIARHLDFINQEHSNIDKPFNLLLNMDNLVALGFVKLDKRWAEKINRVFISYLDGFQYCYGDISIKYNYIDRVQSLSISEILILCFELIRLKKPLLSLLKFQFRRLKSPQVRRALIDVVRIFSHKKILKENRKIEGLNADLFVDLGLFLKQIHYERLGIFVNFLERFDLKGSKTKFFLSEIYYETGKFKEALLFSEKNDVNNLMVLQSYMFMNKWDLVLEQLSLLFETPDFFIHSGILQIVNRIPSEVDRKNQLVIFEDVLYKKIKILNPKIISLYLSTLYLNKDFDKLLFFIEKYNQFLDYNSQKFFNRWLDIYLGKIETFNQYLCVSLSKMGTTSLDSYMKKAGFFCAHFVNPITQKILDKDDVKLFDFVSDNSVAYLARNNLLDCQKVIFLNRNRSNWEASFIQHFSRQLNSEQSFDSIKKSFFDSEYALYKSDWFYIHNDLHFKYHTLEDSYNNHSEWAGSLHNRYKDNMLNLNLESDGNEVKLANFLGINQLKFGKKNSSIRL